MSVSTISRAVRTPLVDIAHRVEYAAYLQSVIDDVAPGHRVVMSDDGTGVRARVPLPHSRELVIDFHPDGSWVIRRPEESRPLAVGSGDHRDALLALEVHLLFQATTARMDVP